MYLSSYHVPMSCHKATVVITEGAHCFYDFMYVCIYIYTKNIDIHIKYMYIYIKYMYMYITYIDI